MKNKSLSERLRELARRFHQMDTNDGDNNWNLLRQAADTIDRLEQRVAELEKAAEQFQPLNYLVQYQGKELGTGPRPWRIMVAYDVVGAAEEYLKKLQDGSADCPWEYRMIAIASPAPDPKP